HWPTWLRLGSLRRYWLGHGAFACCRLPGSPTFARALSSSVRLRPSFSYWQVRAAWRGSTSRQTRSRLIRDVRGVNILLACPSPPAPERSRRLFICSRAILCKFGGCLSDGACSSLLLLFLWSVPGVSLASRGSTSASRRTFAGSSRLAPLSP